MPSVADEIRHRAIDDLRSRTAGERVRIALELGDFDLELFCARHEIAPEVASERVRRSRHRGRRASVAGATRLAAECADLWRELRPNH